MKTFLLSALLILPTFAEENFDHVAAIRQVDAKTLAAGKRLYDLNCAACHGIDGNTTLNPLARRFAADELKFGTDPYSMWKTVSYGNGLMFRWDAVLTPAERYQIVHYVRESLVKPANPTQYSVPDAAYLGKIPALAAADAKEQEAALAEAPVTEGMISGKGGKNMVYGPAQAHSYALGVPKGASAEDRKKDAEGDGIVRSKGDKIRDAGTTEKGMAINLPGPLAASYDMDLLAVTGIWTGGFIDPSNTHHRSHKGKGPMKPGGELLYSNPDGPGWASGSPESFVPDEKRHLNGHYLHGSQVLLSYLIEDREILELPAASAARPLFSRSFSVSPGPSALFALAARLGDGKATISGNTATLQGKSATMTFRVDGDLSGEIFQADQKGGLWVEIPPATEVRNFTLWTTFSAEGEFPPQSGQPDLAALRTGGPPLWPQTVETDLMPGEPVEGYAADELTLPYANPWGSWMRTTALDFFSDGRLAVSTLSGDVWLVTIDGSKLTWKRFATGLYEPLGLKIVDDKILVRGRERITRLHDLNGDGEADFYENFFAEPGIVGSGYHAFIFELQTDRQGNFYYSKSGRSSPHPSAITRISPDGKTSEVIGGDLRHPNGMGFGGPHNWVTISDNPSGKAVYNGVSIVREGGSYGYQKDRNQPMLATIPAMADASSGGQCWADENRWGPLSGQLIHTTYSHCGMFYILTQDAGDFPNGFAIPFPFEFKSGAMRPRVNPADGQLYIVGQKGWDTRSLSDGCLYRIRHTGTASHLISKAEVTPTGLRFTFTCDLDKSSVNATAASAETIADKGKNLRTKVAVDAVTLATPTTVEIAMPFVAKEVLAHRTEIVDGKTIVHVHPPIAVTLKLKASDGSPIEKTVYVTVNSLP